MSNRQPIVPQANIKSLSRISQGLHQMEMPFRSWLWNACLEGILYQTTTSWLGLMNGSVVRGYLTDCFFYVFHPRGILTCSISLECVFKDAHRVWRTKGNQAI